VTWRLATFLVWGALAALLVGCGILTRMSSGRYPDTDALFGVLTAGALRRGVLLLAWMWLGWHAFAR
jgi:hypothetical protein